MLDLFSEFLNDYFANGPLSKEVNKYVNQINSVEIFIYFIEVYILFW